MRRNNKKEMTVDDLAVMIAKTLPTKEETNEGFREVNKRIDKVEIRLSKVEIRLEALEERMDEIERRLDKIEYSLLRGAGLELASLERSQFCSYSRR